MPTNKKRINITVTKEINKALKTLARRDAVPAATKARDLIALALELEEDVLWNGIACERDTQKASYISHHKAWI